MRVQDIEERPRQDSNIRHRLRAVRVVQPLQADSCSTVEQGLQSVQLLTVSSVQPVDCQTDCQIGRGSRPDRRTQCTLLPIAPRGYSVSTHNQRDCELSTSSPRLPLDEHSTS